MAEGGERGPDGNTSHPPCYRQPAPSCADAGARRRRESDPGAEEPACGLRCLLDVGSDAVTVLRFVAAAVGRSSSASGDGARLRFGGRRVYGEWERSSSTSGRSANCRKVGEWYGRGLGATSGTAQTTCTGSGVVQGEPEGVIAEDME
jgi:hypothetical protein